MLLEQSQKLIELSQEKIALQKYANNLDGFKSRQQLISQAVTNITFFIRAFRAFRQRGLVTFDLTQKVDKLLEFITIAEENFQQNPEWILDNKNFKGNIFISSLEGLTKTLTQQLLQAWKNYLTLRMPSTNQEMLNLLGRVDAFKSTVQKIRNLDALIPREEFPKSCEEFDSIDSLIDQLRESWDSLSSDEAPEAVLRFLRATASQGASLTLLTPEVQDWITRHGISDSLRIRLT